MKEQEIIKTKDSKQSDEDSGPMQDLPNQKEPDGNDLKTDEVKEKTEVLEKDEADIIEEPKKEKMLLQQIIYKAVLLLFICLGILLYKANNEKIGITIGLIASMFAILNMLDINYLTFIDFCRKITNKKNT